MRTAGSRTRPAEAVLVALAITTSGCRTSTPTRTVEPRPDGTIFSPLDLPTPNRLRTASGAPGPDYWQQQVDYEIDATLDAGTDTVSGRALVTYTNSSPDPLDYLWLHLEQNLFREDSVGSQMRSRPRSGPSSRSEGYIIEHLAAGDLDLPFHVYDTLARVDLPEPIDPSGGKLVFEIAWHFRIPESRTNRFGIEKAQQGNIYELAQWFPAVAVYDDVHGWNTLPYLGSGEFYTNFGDFDVKLTVPRDHLVCATGVLQNPGEVYTEQQHDRLEQARSSAETVMIRTGEEVDDPASRPDGDGPLTWHFRAERVRTFAWASSAAFIHDACDLDGVLVQSLYPAEKAEIPTSTGPRAAWSTR
jgi:hypothetical protein